MNSFHFLVARCYAAKPEVTVLDSFHHYDAKLLTSFQKNLYPDKMKYRETKKILTDIMKQEGEEGYQCNY